MTLIKKILIITILPLAIRSFGQNSDYHLAENYFKNDDFEKASVIFERLARASVYNTNYLEHLILCYQELKDYDKANKILNDRIKKHPKMCFLHVLSGNNYERQELKEQAINSYEKAISGIENEPSYGNVVAKMFQKINKLNYAIKAYKKTSTIIKDSNFELELGKLYGEQGNYERMFNAFFNYIVINPSNVYNIKYRSSQYITDDPDNPTNLLFKKLLLKRSTNDPKPHWNQLLSWFFSKQKQYGAALIQEKALYARGNKGLYQINKLGKLAFEEKTYSVAKSCYEFVQEKTKNKTEKFKALAYLQEIAIKTNQEDIDNQFKKLFQIYGYNTQTIPIQLVYADYLTFTKNQTEQATKLLEQAIKLTNSRFTKASIKLKLGDILVYQRRFSKALIYFSQVQSKFQDHYLGQEARFKVAQTSYFKHDFDWAKAQLKVLKGSATQLIANDATALFLTISDNQTKDSLETGLTQYAQASFFKYQKKNKESIDILNNLITTHKGQKIEDEAQYQLGKLHQQNKHFNKAITCYNRVLEIDKEGIYVDDSIYNLAEIYAEQQQLEKAKKYYEKLILEYPSSIYMVDARRQFRKLRGDAI